MLLHPVTELQDHYCDNKSCRLPVTVYGTHALKCAMGCDFDVCARCMPLGVSRFPHLPSTMRSSKTLCNLFLIRESLSHQRVSFVPPVAHQVKGCLGHNSVAPPRTSLLAAKAQPLLDALKRPTPALRAFTDALFDALDSQFEPRRTGYIERTKIIKESELIADYYPDFADTEVAESKWKTKALYKSGGFAYVKTLHGDALTKAGYAAIWAFQMSISPGKSYGMACVLAVRLNLPAHAHVVRQQFPCDLSAEAEQAAWLQCATRYNKVLGSFWKYQATQVDYMPLVIGGAKLAVKQMGSSS